MSKQLLPIYDKPMVYYPLSTLMLAGIREILVISTPAGPARASSGCSATARSWASRSPYAEQPQPDGIAQAFLIGREFIGGDRVALVLGDNIFYGHGLRRDAAARRRAAERARPCSATGCSDPERYGVVEFDGDGEARSSIEEKPQQPQSNYAVTGLYFYDPTCSTSRARSSPPRAASSRSPTSTAPTSQAASCTSSVLGRGFAWLDTGTHESLLQAQNFIQAIEERQGLKVACLEEIAFRMGWIDGDAAARRSPSRMEKNAYGDYLMPHRERGPRGEVRAASRCPR